MIELRPIWKPASSGEAGHGSGELLQEPQMLP